MKKDSTQKQVVLYKKEENCCGCGACEAICPKGAIIMEMNLRGFYYPRIDIDRCVGCEACIHVCSFNNQKEQP